MDPFILAIFQVVVLLYSVVVHEVSHGVMANALGDPTAKHLGRLTLNPLKHLDPFGSIVLPLFLFVIGSPFIFGYAKPVPYDPRNLSDRRFGPAKVAFAGPASNIALALLFGFVLRFLPAGFSWPLLPELLSFIVLINLVLAFFNLFPIPPLDGHWLLNAFLPARFLAIRIALYRYSWLLLFLFLFFVFPFLFRFVLILFRLITGLSPGIG